MSISQARQNFHSESEAAINRQINFDLYSSYVYMSMAMYYDRDDVALFGFKKFFKHLSEGERKQAEVLMQYQNKRGGRIVLQIIQKPERDEWGSGQDGMQAALTLEKSINQSVMELHKIACSYDDEHLSDFLEDHFLPHQVDNIKTISDYITQLKNVGAGLGEFQFDKELSDTEF